MKLDVVGRNRQCRRLGAKMRIDRAWARNEPACMELQCTPPSHCLRCESTYKRLLYLGQDTTMTFGGTSLPFGGASVVFFDGGSGSESGSHGCK